MLKPLRLRRKLADARLYRLFHNEVKRFDGRRLERLKSLDAQHEALNRKPSAFRFITGHGALARG